MLAYQKNKPSHICILYIKNSNEECFIGFKAHAFKGAMPHYFSVFREK